MKLENTVKNSAEYENQMNKILKQVRHSQTLFAEYGMFMENGKIKYSEPKIYHVDDSQWELGELEFYDEESLLDHIKKSIKI
jgi:uncharacterized protein YacL (UPF0231 family)